MVALGSKLSKAHRMAISDGMRKTLRRKKRALAKAAPAVKKQAKVKRRA
jgi:hypothetical protein